MSWNWRNGWSLRSWQAITFLIKNWDHCKIQPPFFYPRLRRFYYQTQSPKISRVQEQFAILHPCKKKSFPEINKQTTQRRFMAHAKAPPSFRLQRLLLFNQQVRRKRINEHCDHGRREMWILAVVPECWWLLGGECYVMLRSAKGFDESVERYFAMKIRAGSSDFGVAFGFWGRIGYWNWRLVSSQ